MMESIRKWFYRPKVSYVTRFAPFYVCSLLLPRSHSVFSLPFLHHRSTRSISLCLSCPLYLSLSSLCLFVFPSPACTYAFVLISFFFASLYFNSFFKCTLLKFLPSLNLHRVFSRSIFHTLVLNRESIYFLFPSLSLSLPLAPPCADRTRALSFLFLLSLLVFTVDFPSAVATCFVKISHDTTYVHLCECARARRTYVRTYTRGPESRNLRNYENVSPDALENASGNSPTIFRW